MVGDKSQAPDSHSVYPSSDRSDGDEPAYRGQLAELGPGIRGLDDRLAVRPGSVGWPTPSVPGRPATARPPCAATWVPAAMATRRKPEAVGAARGC